MRPTLLLFTLGLADNALLMRFYVLTSAYYIYLFFSSWRDFWNTLYDHETSGAALL